MSSMTDNETYNGYANRETWAFNLHWQNDQGLYEETLYAARIQVAADADLSDYSLGEQVVSYWQERADEFRKEFDPDHELYRMERAVGSWWRIDYREVGEAVRESLGAEGN